MDRVPDSRGANCRGQNRADRSRGPAGEGGGTGVPPGLLRVPARPVGAGRGGGMPEAVLEEGLDNRSGCREVLRQRPVGPDHQGGARRTPTCRGCCCMSSGGWPPRCSSPTAPCWTGTGEPRKGHRCRPCWRTCSCTTRSTPGSPGSTRGSSSSGTPTTRSCTAPPNARPAGPGGDREADGTGGVAAAPGQDPDRAVCPEREGGPDVGRPDGCGAAWKMKVVALRSRPSGGGFKPPHAALAEDRRRERVGKGASRRQVGIGKASASESLRKCRN